MKKIYLSLALAALFVFNAHAFDLATAANKVADSANQTAATVEANKKAAADRKVARKEEAAQKKAELEKKIADKKAEAAKKKAEKDAENAAKSAERKKALEDAKNSVNNLKNALAK